MSLNNKDEQMEKDKIYGYWGVVKAFASIAAISVISYKVLITPIDLKIDFPTLLSLLLAFFSVALSALFYFKATETSNNFYDNTHKFTRDIAQLLAKMESGFGERLKHLDEGYSSVRDHLQTNGSSYSTEDSKRKIKEEKEQAKKTIEERENIINSLIEKAHIDGAEKDTVLEQLNEKDRELKDSRDQIQRLKKQQVREKMNSRSTNSLINDKSFIEYVENVIVNPIGHSLILNSTIRSINSHFSDVLDNLADPFINDLIELGLIDDEKDLTKKGVMFLKKIAKDGLGENGT
jgi:hypothetical protein